MPDNQRTRAEIHLGNLVHNLCAIQGHVAPALVIPVVKADAYGHGALPVARTVAAAGCGMLAVAQFKEAMSLRNSGIVNPILIFGRLMPDEMPEAVAAGFRISLFGVQDLEWLQKAGIRGRARVHVNLETGMGRVGVIPENEPDFFEKLIGSAHCTWEGLYTHFSTSDEADKRYATLQLQRFNRFVTAMRKWPHQPVMIHMANSGAVLDIPASRFDAVRAGIIMYGHYPSSATSRSIPLKPVMHFKTYVAHVRTLPAGHPVSYGRRWIAEKKTRIAVIPVGYADGIPRAMTNRGEVLINGSRYPMVGTVTMDQTMVHIGDGAVAVGDEVLLWGESSGGSLPLLELAEKIGTIPYELTCGVSARVARSYIPATQGDHGDALHGAGQ